MMLRVSSIQRGCVYDGPGMRTTVFLKGCTMRCPWCCNPETISADEEFFIDDSKCLLKNGHASKFCESCERNGGNKKLCECPFGVSEPVSKDYTAVELYEMLSKDFILMRSSGGGVTFSGGEPLLQIDSLESLLKKLKDDGIHIAFETTLTTSDESTKKAAQYADLFIVDLKLQPEHSLYNNAIYIGNLRRSLSICHDKGVELTYRLVYVDSMLDVVEKVAAELRNIGIFRIELLLCHNLGSIKYKKLNMSNQDLSANRKEYDVFSQLLSDRHIIVNKLSI